MPQEVLSVMHELAFAFVAWFAYFILLVCLAALFFGTCQEVEVKHK